MDHERIFGSIRLRTLLIANVAISVTAMVIAGVSPHLADTLFMLPSRPADFLTQPWSLLTYMFTQFSFLHLFLNLIWLWGFGLLCERHIGNSFPLIRVYLLCGIASGIVYLLWGLSGVTAGRGLVGSSGAIMGIVAAIGMLSPREKVLLFGAFSVEMRWVSIVVALLAFIGSGEQFLSSVAAHSGGLAAGIVWTLCKKKKQSDGAVRTSGALKFRKGRKKEEPKRYYNDRERLNELLDKINASGFDSLTPEEKRELVRISR